MTPRVYMLSLATAIMLVLAIMPTVSPTSNCPASQPNFGPYNRVEILNINRDSKGYRLVNEPLIVRAMRVDGKEESPLRGRSIRIYKISESGTETMVASGDTDNKGEYRYTPTEPGRHKVEVADKGIFFIVYRKVEDPTELGAVCGDGKCEAGKMETQKSCPVDCTVCGDAVCEGNEDKDNCPDDCIICGDGVCDREEYWPSGCACPDDCIICGDNSCDMAHGETPETCSKDCKKPVAKAGPDFLGRYWWIMTIAAGIIVGFVVLRRRAAESWDEREKSERKGHIREAPVKAKGRKRSLIEEDSDINNIIVELLDTGVSDKRIKEKLKEFGLEKDEIDTLITKAKRSK